MRETRRTEARFGGDRQSLDGAWPRAASLAKHWVVHALHSGGKAQTEHRSSPFYKWPNEKVNAVAAGDPC